MRIVFSWLLVLAASTLAWAYVPPTQKVLEQWVATYQKAPSLALEGSLQIGAETYPFKVVSTDDSLVYLQNGKPVTDSTSRFVFGALTRPAKAFQTLRSRGLDVTKNGFARSGGRIAWTLGVTGEKQPGSQVWVDRETYAPLLLVYAPAGDADVRIEFTGYEQSQSKLFPTEIKVTFEGGSTRVYQIHKISQVK